MMKAPGYTWIICPECEGGGLVNLKRYPDSLACPPCHGSGRVALFAEFREAVELLREKDSPYRESWAATDGSALMVDVVEVRG